MIAKFLEAQEFSYNRALSEMQEGYKASHWIWFIFPQIQGLGSSHMSQLYEFKNFDEARLYIKNDILRTRLLEITQVVYDLDAQDIEYVMGYPDHLKLCSCMTLFALIAPEYPIFQQMLDRYFHGQMCEHTINLWNKQ